MRLRNSTTELNIVAEIDELIMELTYIKNGHTPSDDKLKRGLELIELIISFSEKPKQKVNEEKFGYTSFHDMQHYYSGNYNVAEYIDELEKAKESIKEFMENPKESDKTDIEKIQELMLKISVPIWDEEITVLKPKQYKSIQL
jgi:hypothetical protein